MKNLFIVGNGFDLNLGLKTSYSDFIKSDEFKILCGSRNHLCEHLFEKSNLVNWIDIENELPVFSNMTFKNKYNFKKDFDELTKTLIKYLRGIDKDYDEDSKAYEFLKITASNNDYQIIDYNYTNTVSDLLERLGKTEEEIAEIHIKIHGSVQEGKIIFGVSDKAEIKKEHVFLRKAYNFHYKAIDCEKLLKDVNSVIFFGFSFGEMDHTYFNDFFFRQCGRSCEDSYINLMQQLDVLTGKNLSAFKLRNKVKIMDTSLY